MVYSVCRFFIAFYYITNNIITQKKYFATHFCIVFKFFMIKNAINRTFSLYPSVMRGKIGFPYG